jgi:hypothetical protein
MYRIVNAGVHNDIVNLLFFVQFGHTHKLVNVEFFTGFFVNSKIVQTGCKITRNVHIKGKVDCALSYIILWKLYSSLVPI